MSIVISPMYLSIILLFSIIILFFFQGKKRRVYKESIREDERVD